ncbi:glutaredoxin family protein [Paenarthrobacter sp. C1]|uniref:glutaredoxin family protein n=1 Tax=Paenarthrobacter sp. C1 TaxID=3400220 RepID=UPI003BF50C8B
MSPVTTSTSPKSVVVFGKEKGCVQCNAQDRAVAKTNLLITKKNGSTEENKEFCKSLGHMQAPVTVVYQDGVVIDHWGGFNPGKIEELNNDPLVERVAPVLELVAA